MISLLLLFLLCLVSTNTDTHDPKVEESTLVFENHGVILKSQGLIASNSNKQHVSIFQKFQLPKSTNFLNVRHGSARTGLMKQTI